MKFVSKEIAIKLKEKGFDKPCFGWYDSKNIENNMLYFNITKGDGDYKDLLEYTNDFEWIIDAPTIEQALEWLREEKDIYIWIEPYNTHTTKNHLSFAWNITLGKFFKSKDQFDDKDTLYPHIPLDALDIEHWKEDYNDAYIEGIKYVINNLI